MAPAGLEIVGLPERLEKLPCELYQRSSWSSAATRLALLVPALLIVLIPAGSLLLSVAPAAAQVAAHPADAIMAGTGLSLFLLLFGVPLHRALRSLGVHRTVRLEPCSVTVEQITPFRKQIWTMPLTDFEGVAHVVRTNLSGTRHELVLVHPVRSRQVLLHTADRLTEAEVEQASTLLRLPILPAERVLWPRRSSGIRRPTERLVATPAVATPAIPVAQAA